MSDHIDGPRSIGDPSIDVTDLFAFASPENPGRTVLAACVFPSAGVSAMFSNAVNHAIVVRRVSVAGLGKHAKFKSGDPEFRFNFQFTTLERGANDAKPTQHGTCTLPDGQKLTCLVNDEKGSSTPDGVFRIFAGLRSDAFNLSWIGGKPGPNLLEHDNVLATVIEFDTNRVLAPDRGPLFGVIAETTARPQPRGFVGHPPPRYDWVGRPEQTNMRLDNAGVPGQDLRDLWNQQTPFAIAEEFQPAFRKRLLESLTEIDMSDGKADWTSAELASAANVFLDDFLLFDVTKPMSDTTFLEIEKSTLQGKSYRTGGGRTLDANVMDIMITWATNHDRELLRGGATHPSKPGMKTFPYLASPNTELQTVSQSMDLAATPDKVWSVIGDFGGTWHPLIVKVQLIGTGIGQLRVIETIDGKQIIERLEAVDDSQMSYRYTMVSGIPATDYTGTLEIKPKGSGCSVEWRVQYWADGQPDIIVKTVVTSLLKTGLASLTQRFGVS